MRKILHAVFLFLLVATTFSQSPRKNTFKCDVNDDAEYLQLLLLRAVRKGDETCVKKLLKLGVNINASYESDLHATPIFTAVAHEQTNMVDILFENGVDRKSEGVKLAFFYACDTGQVHLLRRFLLAGVSVNLTDNQGLTALVHAAALGNLSMLKLLMNHGADPNIASVSGATALMAVGDNEPLVQFLIDSGSSIDAINNIGQTAVFSAVTRKQKRKLEVLLQNRANPNIRDRNGISAVEAAKQLPESESKREILSLFVRFGGKQDL